MLNQISHKKQKRTVNGILLLNKAINITSNQALQQVKRFYQAEKAGHTGSLDPLATGVLPICLGEAAKFSQYLLDADKVYTVWGRLGYSSITGDAEGEVIPVDNAPRISKIQLEAALKHFLGTIEQVPPMYSALKKDGVPLYQLARQGIEIERKSRTITIYAIQLDEYDEHAEKYQDFKITVHCSKGTYIRTLVEDIARHLHSGAYLLNLRRDKAGPYKLENSMTIEQLRDLSEEEGDALLLAPEAAVADYPDVFLDAAQTAMIQQGKILSDFTQNSVGEMIGLVRLFHEQHFLGLGEIFMDGTLRSKRLMKTILA